MSNIYYSFIQKPILLETGSFFTGDVVPVKFITSDKVLSNKIQNNGNDVKISVYIQIEEVDNRTKKEYYRFVEAIMEHNLDGNVWWSFELPLTNYYYIDFYNPALSHSFYFLETRKTYNLKIRLKNGYNTDVGDLVTNSDYCLDITDKLNSMTLSPFSNEIQFVFNKAIVPKTDPVYISSINKYIIELSFDDYALISKYQIIFSPVDTNGNPLSEIEKHKTRVLFAPKIKPNYTVSELPNNGDLGIYYKLESDGLFYTYHQGFWKNSALLVVNTDYIKANTRYFPSIFLYLTNKTKYRIMPISDPYANLGGFTVPNFTAALNTEASTFQILTDSNGIPVVNLIAFFDEPSKNGIIIKKSKKNPITNIWGNWIKVKEYNYDEALSERQESIKDYFNSTEDSNTIKYGCFVLSEQKTEGRNADVSSQKIIGEEMNSNMIIGYSENEELLIYRFIADVKFGEMKLKNNANIQETLGSSYPYYIKNSINNYYSSSLSGLVIEVIDRCGSLNYPTRQEIENRRNLFLIFLANGLPKVLRTWNGDVRVISILDNVSYSPNNDLGGTLGNVSFEYVEVCAADNYSELEDLGIASLIDVVPL